MVNLDSTKKSKFFLSNNSINDISPEDSSLSYRLIGYIFNVDILLVPVCGVSISLEEEPVKI